MNRFKAYWHQSIDEISKEDWDSIADSSPIPFYQWGWFSKLEKSKSVDLSSGWKPMHLSIWKDQEIISILREAKRELMSIAHLALQPTKELTPN